MTQNLRTKRGSSIFGDLTWIIVFCVCAMLLFFFLYKPLVDDLKGKTNPGIGGFSEQQLPVYSDAQYVALGLREIRPEAGTDGTSRATVSQLITALIQTRHEKDSDTAFKKAIEDSEYDETLEKQFGKGSPFWTGSAYQLADGTKIKERQAIAVIINDGGTWLTETCQEFTFEGRRKAGTLCSYFTLRMINGVAVTDPDTGMKIPLFPNSVVEAGSLYIPTASGPATMYVFVERRSTKP